MRELAGRVAVVTGGGSGIGEALCLACADAGMDVVCADLAGDAAERAADAVRARGRRGLAVETDVSRADSVEALAKEAIAAFGACHLLCNNAGTLVIGPAAESSEEEWRRCLDVNVMGVVHGVRAFVPGMKARGEEAHIVNTASVSGLVSVPAMGVYVTTKYAIVGLSESLREDLAPHRIGVTALCPGGVKTRLIGRALEEAGGAEAAKRGLDHLMNVARTTGEGDRDLQDAGAVAAATLAAVRANAPYCVTHGLYRPMVEERFRRILEAFRAGP